ncbi:TPA: hypothetical protein DCY43_04290 [candidate division WWE3 bacterium]|uniref:Uncharacterized protein n=4 Tax=Katanobacteria TaxID=422282 RepID=A0A0G1KMZ4_UNCKA|nr:MAG: hypothetical protein UW65_C0044G0004 [candidate division WWE3 bacterium GW2011_GWB1_44_4]KKT84860.1 MAG: hypothetical protein UW82_C0008G0007 [candidate division WWE3 bacterium GW2011_GWC2_44_9]OGC52099.1 MAG: hypothetical protein A2709_01995 [candidate division WWE3 bacterium RIFCSPHIGHO2_01_FULL_43_9]HAZ29924.1 hypothetical protein [candidate division WWE3 bacterium]
MPRTYLILALPFFSLFTFVKVNSAYAAPPAADEWMQSAEGWKEKFKVDTIKEKLQERLEAKREEVCARVRSRVGERYEGYYNIKIQRLAHLKKGLEALNSRIAFYKEQGLDTEVLESDYSKLSALASEYESELTKFMTLFDETKDLPCLRYEGDFVSKVQAVRDQWRVVKAKGDEIRDYYRDNVKAHIKALREQLKGKVDKTEED